MISETISTILLASTLFFNVFGLFDEIVKIGKVLIDLLSCFIVRFYLYVGSDVFLQHKLILCVISQVRLPHNVPQEIRSVNTHSEQYLLSYDLRRRRDGLWSNDSDQVEGMSVEGLVEIMGLYNSVIKDIYLGFLVLSDITEEACVGGLHIN